MKTILIIIGLLAIPAHAAETWFPVGKENAKTVYAKKSVCESAEGQDCFDITNNDPRFHDVQTSMVDDMTKPIYKPKYDIVNCDSPENCAEVAGDPANNCTTGDYRDSEKNSPPIPGYSSFCIGIDSYEQKEVKTLVVNEAQKTSVEADDAAKAAEAQAIADIAKDAAFGNRMIAFVGARIRAKSLSLADTKLVLSDYAAVMSLLRAGSITHAKTEVEGMTPDGTRVSQADKDALLAEVNAYLGQ